MHSYFLTKPTLCEFRYILPTIGPRLFFADNRTSRLRVSNLSRSKTETRGSRWGPQPDLLWTILPQQNLHLGSAPLSGRRLISIPPPVGARARLVPAPAAVCVPPRDSPPPSTALIRLVDAVPRTIWDSIIFSSTTCPVMSPAVDPCRVLPRLGHQAFALDIRTLECSCVTSFVTPRERTGHTTASVRQWTRLVKVDRADTAIADQGKMV